MESLTKKISLVIVGSFLFGTSALVFQNCSRATFAQRPEGDISSKGDNTGACPTGQILTAGSCQKVICDAFSTLSSSNVCEINHGLIGNLYYFNLNYDASGNVTNIPSGTTTDYYVKNAVKSPEIMYLPRLEVPTREFSKGFVSDGVTLKNTQGVAITEYFALDLYSSLMAQSASEEGDYQIVVKSDDGSVLEVADNQSFDVNKHPSAYAYSVLVNNDNIHMPNVGCSTRTVHISSTQSMPIHLKYFQGPRYLISLSVYWRKMAPGQPLKSGDYCNKWVEADAELARDGFKVIPKLNYVAPKVF